MASAGGANKTRSLAVRERLDHPVVDGDGHTVELQPLVFEYLREVGGQKVIDDYTATFPAGPQAYDGPLERIGGPRGWYGLSPQERREMRVTRPSFWAQPTTNALDRATVMIPQLYRERLDDLGIDFAVVYSSGLNFMRMQDETLRRAGCRALNTMYANIFGPHADRITVPALIPTFTPEEAVDELEHAVTKLGLKSVTLGTCIRRPIASVARKTPETAPFATWMDVIALDSEYDYDPVWKKCVELKVAVTAHSGGMGWGSRTSISNFVYNHIGHFGAANEAFCKALVMGGVVQRFPTLRFAFLEGGVGWACGLYNDLIEHWETRNVKALYQFLDPSKLDREAIKELVDRYGGKRLEGRYPLGGEGGAGAKRPDVSAADLDDWRNLKIDDPREFATIFERFYFGCEAEDRMTAVAFNAKLNHFGAKLQAFLGSDVGHFDVRDITAVLAEAYELVEAGLLSDDDFRRFTFSNAVRLHGGMNPAFFRGTVVEAAAEAELSSQAAAS